MGVKTRPRMSFREWIRGLEKRRIDGKFEIPWNAIYYHTLLHDYYSTTTPSWLRVDYCFLEFFREISIIFLTWKDPPCFVMTRCVATAVLNKTYSSCYRTHGWMIFLPVLVVQQGLRMNFLTRLDVRLREEDPFPSLPSYQPVFYLHCQRRCSEPVHGIIQFLWCSYQFNVHSFLSRFT